MKNRSLIALLCIAFCSVIFLIGCGLNTRSVAENEPVPVQVNTDVDNTNNGAGSNQEENSNQGGDQPAGDGSGEEASGDGGQNPDQPAADDQGDGYVAPETPREEQPAEGNGDNAAAAEGEDNNANQENGGEQAAQEPTPIPPTPVPATETPETQNNSGQATTHVVARGETLFSIAQRYNLTVAELAAANGIVNVNSIDAGQELVIPAAGTVVVPTGETTHIVAAGETLFRIGLRYGFTVAELAAYNNISNVNSLEIGQEIKIPPQ